MKAYCDGSGNAESSDVAVLAGVAASEGVWARFELQWDVLLKARDPAAPYLHMRELAAASGAFDDDKGWSDAKRQSLLTDIFLYVQELDKKLFRHFVCTLDAKQYRCYKAELKDRMPCAVSMMNRFVPTEIFNWYCSNFEQWLVREIYYFFDQGEKFKGPFERQVRNRQKQSRLSNAWHMVRGVNHADMRMTPPLQLADVIAWAHQRRLTGDEYTKWHNLHIFSDAVMPGTRKELDAKTLKYIADAARTSEFPLQYFK